MNIKNRQQFLMVCVLTLVAIWVGNLLVYGPMVKWWQSRQAQVKELRTEVTQGKSLIRRETYIRNEWSSMRTNSLPNDSSQAEQQVLRAFDSWAGDSGANVTSITPQWQQDEDDYSTLDCRVEASGDLGTLSRFIYEIENDPMALQLASIELTANDDRGQQLTLGLEVNGLALVSPKP
jgi:Tfp pilus assembly protein PilO